jgi:hypothetical protein
LIWNACFYELVYFQEKHYKYIFKKNTTNIFWSIMMHERGTATLLKCGSDYLKKKNEYLMWTIIYLFIINNGKGLFYINNVYKMINFL